MTSQKKMLCYGKIRITTLHSFQGKGGIDPHAEVCPTTGTSEVQPDISHGLGVIISCCMS